MSSELGSSDAPGGQGELFIVSAPSGTGKSTLIRHVLAGRAIPLDRVVHAVSHTTRRPRRSEVDGREYHFVNRPAFEALVAEDGFLEWAEYNGHLYGTSQREVVSRLEQGIDVVVDIEVQGAEQLLRRYPRAHGVFVVPPSYAELEGRLRSRGQDSDEDIARRLAVSHWEIERYRRYDYVIINDDLERAGRALAAIILEKRHRLPRVDSRVREILADFEEAAPVSQAEGPDDPAGDPPRNP